MWGWERNPDHTNPIPMEITTVSSFLNYYRKVKGRTQRLFPYIPPEKIEWTYRKGKFTIGDILRHLANIDRYMYGENVKGKPSLYKGCGIEYAEGYEAVIQYYKDKQEEVTVIFASLEDEDLMKKSTTPAGIQITTWKWLRAMIEHEIHHRGQLYTYLGLLEIDPPPLYGLTSEQVAAYSGSSPEK